MKYIYGAIVGIIVLSIITLAIILSISIFSNNRECKIYGTEKRESWVQFIHTSTGLIPIYHPEQEVKVCKEYV